MPTEDDYAAAKEFMATYGNLTAQFINFSLTHLDEETRVKFKKYFDTPSFRMSVVIDIEPQIKVRLLACADHLEPWVVFELFPAPMMN